MQTIAEIKAAVSKLERIIIYLETRSFAVLLTEEQQAELETAKKELDILEKKQRLEELRKELQDGQLSYGELAELQSLAPYIEKGDVELLEAAGVPEFEEDETAEEQPETYYYYIDYLNAEKNHTKDRVNFSTYEEAKEWGRANIEYFHSDMVIINPN